MIINIKTILTVLLILIAVISCDNYDISSKQSDSFIKFYGASALDYGSDVKQLPNGNYFITGTISLSESNTSAFTLVTDEYGNSATDLKIIDGKTNASSRISMTALLPDGGIAAIGTYQVRSGNNDIWVLRFNNQGDTIWTRKFGSSNNDEGLGLTINENNEIVCIGYTTVVVGTNIPDKQIWMHKLSLEGNELWDRERNPGFTDPGNRFAIDDIGNSILNVSDGYIILRTTTGYPPGTTDKNIIVQKYDKNGINPILTLTIEEENDEEGTVIKALPDGSLLVLATTTSLSTGNSDILLLKLDQSFNIIWQKTIKESENDNEISGSLIYRDNRIHILGTSFDTRNDTKKMLFVTTDSNGENPVFHKFGLTKEKIEGFGMDETSDGGFIFTGSNILLYKMLNPDDL